jgi:molybdate transport system ATP-binding protein
VSDNLLEVQIRHTLHTAHGILPMEVTFELPKAGIMALTGPSGAGKTTLLKQIAGLIMPESGTITFNGEPWLNTPSNVHLPAQERNIGFVFQDYALFPHLTVLGNLLFALPRDSKPDIAHELLEITGLTGLAQRKPYEISGGQQQRVALARALVREPDLLLMDEPFAALDPDMRYQLQDLLLRLRRQHSFSAIVVTHNIGEIFRLADQVAVMDSGKLLRFGTPSEIYLSEKEPAGEMLIYGEVLTCERKDDHLTVNAWIENRVRELKLPLHLEPQLAPGSAFTMHYSANPAQIRIVGS